MGFAKEKKDFLSKRDKSKKGNIDEEIKPLVELINSFENHYTTSSCSGRIVLLEIKNPEKKNESNWLFVSHKPVKFRQIKNAVDGIKGKIPIEGFFKIWFRIEPAILHIASKDIYSAVKLMDTARQAGFKRSGIISIKDNKVMTEIIGTERMDTLAARNGKWLISDGYLQELVNEANEKLRNTRIKTENFMVQLRSITMQSIK